MATVIGNRPGNQSMNSEKYRWFWEPVKPVLETSLNGIFFIFNLIYALKIKKSHLMKIKNRYKLFYQFSFIKHNLLLLIYIDLLFYFLFYMWTGYG